MRAFDPFRAPQLAIFAQGTHAQHFLEFDLRVRRHTVPAVAAFPSPADTPTPSTMARASTISTALARKAATMSRTVVAFTRIIMRPARRPRHRRTHWSAAENWLS